jgi:hypothetical protein
MEATLKLSVEEINGIFTHIIWGMAFSSQD